MPKQRLSRQGFADEVNRRIAKHAAYRQGMRTELTPPKAGEAAATGYTYNFFGDGSEGAQRAAFAEIEKQVRDEFDTEDFTSLPDDSRG